MVPLFRTSIIARVYTQSYEPGLCDHTEIDSDRGSDLLEIRHAVSILSELLEPDYGRHSGVSKSGK